MNIDDLTYLIDICGLSESCEAFDVDRDKAERDALKLLRSLKPSSENPYLQYEPLENPGRKTVIEAVVSTSSGVELGQIRWWPCWRKHAFFPSPNTVFEPSCLEAIIARCRELTAEHKARRKANA